MKEKSKIALNKVSEGHLTKTKQGSAWGFLWVNRFGNGLLIGWGNLEWRPQAVRLQQRAGGGCVPVIISAIIDQTDWVVRWSGMMDFMAPAQSRQLSWHKQSEKRRKSGRRKELRTEQVWRHSVWRTISNFSSTFAPTWHLITVLQAVFQFPQEAQRSLWSAFRWLKSSLRNFFFWCLSVFWENVERLNWHSETLELLLRVLPQSLCHPPSPLKSPYFL